MRLIDADALWMDVIHSMDYCDDILEMIESQPTIEPEQRWISCSERLPEVDKEVFVYLFKDSPYIAWLDDCGIWFTEDFYVDEDEQPVAWMPLPELYKDVQ